MRHIFFPLILAFCRFASAQVILSEVMFNPRGNENANEFIEIFNASHVDSVWLLGWRIGEQNETDLLVSPDSLYWLAPGQFAVVLDPGYFLESDGIYDALIPSHALILTIDDNTFGSGGLSNSTPETVLLIDNAGRTVASYTYSIDNPDGISDEKIFLNADDSPQNWGNSRRTDGTPGQRNSVTPRERDGELVAGSLFISPPRLREGQSATISVTLRNAGLQTIAGASVEFFIMGSSAPLPLPFRLGSAQLSFGLASRDSARLNIEWENAITGRHSLAANLILNGDEFAGNDTLRANFSVGYQRGVVRINEIMYAPASGQPEWIEIFNPQSTVVSLAEWILQDESGTRSVIPSGAVIPASSYRVLAAGPAVAAAYGIADSLVVTLTSFPTLNNDGDVVLLRDFSNAVIDSVAYQMNWGASDISTEKIWFERENLAENWRPSRDPRGGTPGAINSVSPRDLDIAVSRLSFDPAQPQAGDDVTLSATVRNSGRQRIDQFAVTFAVDRNSDNEAQAEEIIGTLTVNQAMIAEDTTVAQLLWLQPFAGRHRILAVAQAPLDAVTENNRISIRLPVGYMSRSVIINEIYYASRSGEVEWVEFYNRSAQPVDLSEWRWRDGDANVPIVLPDSTRIIQPGAFAVLAAGPNIAQLAPQASLIVLNRWLTLNNDRDQLVLTDFHNRLQDSLSYTAKWGGDTGVSLERINPHLASADSSNWSSCVNPLGSTPGQRNSIFTELVPQQAALSASPQPFSPDGDGIDDFAIIQIQVPTTTAFVHLKIYDIRGRLVRHLLNSAPIGSSYEVVWDGDDDGNIPAPMGIYILFLQALQASGGVSVEARTTLVLARRLN
jgi:hypothetical protein